MRVRIKEGETSDRAKAVNKRAEKKMEHETQKKGKTQRCEACIISGVKK